MKVWAVRRFDDPVSPTILSAWPDIYAAKFEAGRWEQDSKVKHDYVEAELALPGNALVTDHPFQSVDDREVPMDSVHSEHCQFVLPGGLRCARLEIEHSKSRREWFHKGTKSHAGVDLVPEEPLVEATLVEDLKQRLDEECLGPETCGTCHECQKPQPCPEHHDYPACVERGCKFHPWVL